MDLKKNISLFLKRKLLEYNLTSKQFADKSEVPFSTVSHIRQGLLLNPELKTILKIADFFQCSVDEVAGRDFKYFTKKNISSLTKQSIDKLTNNLKIFINKKAVKHNLSLSRLSLNLGLNSTLLANLFHPEPKIKSLSTLSVCKIADYFDISIDEMIGRVSYHSKQSSDIPTHEDSLGNKDKVSQVIKTFQEADKPKNRETIMTAAERLIEQVIIQGREEGMKLVALNMLKKNVNKNLISEVTGLSLEELDSLTCTCD